MLGAHTDSVASGPGINDNGSGVAALLELAKQLAQYRINSRVRFAFWTSEESGLLGSRHWVNSTAREELDKIRLYLNFDMIGSPNFKVGAYDSSTTHRKYHKAPPVGSEHAERIFNDFFHGEGWQTSGSAFDGRSDYAPFIERGIPSGGAATGADGLKTEAEAQMFGGVAGQPYDHNYHLDRDDLSNVNWTALGVNTKAIAHVLATYARSFEGFPDRVATQKRAVDAPVVMSGGLCGGDEHEQLDWCPNCW